MEQFFYIPRIEVTGRLHESYIIGTLSDITGHYRSGEPITKYAFYGLK